MNTKIVIKNAKKEFTYKIITSIFVRGLLLIIPIFWTRAVGRLTEGSFNKFYLFNNKVYKWDMAEKKMIETDYTCKEIVAKDFRT